MDFRDPPLIYHPNALFVVIVTFSFFDHNFLRNGKIPSFNSAFIINICLNNVHNLLLEIEFDI